MYVSWLLFACLFCFSVLWGSLDFDLVTEGGGRKLLLRLEKSYFHIVSINGYLLEEGSLGA